MKKTNTGALAPCPKNPPCADPSKCDPFDCPHATPAITQVERAMLIMMRAQTEYLHLIAWSTRSAESTGEKVRQVAEESGRMLMRDCPGLLPILTPQSSNPNDKGE